MRARNMALLAALAALILVSPAAAKKPRPRPDLEISNVTFSRYAFAGEAAIAAKFCDRTTNLGKAATAHGLDVKWEVAHDFAHNHPVVLAQRRVPRLGGTVPRKGHHRPYRYSHSGCARGKNTALTLPLGAYDVAICADYQARERNTANNCHICKNCFFVVKRTWTGTVNGENELPPTGDISAKATWQSASVTFSFGGEQGKSGVFTYSPAGGSVNYQIAGTSQDCSAAGGATHAIAGGRLRIDTIKENYDIYGMVANGATIPVTITCKDNALSLTYPAPLLFLSNGFDKGYTDPLPFGQDQVGGRYDTAGGGTTHYLSDWSLR